MSARSEALLLAGLVVLAAVLRFTGIGFGLDLDDPGRTQIWSLIDERGMVEAVQEEILQGSLHPGKFLYRGPAGMVLFGVPDAVLVAAAPGPFSARVAALAANPSFLHLVHRCIAALAGVAGVIVIARMLRREFGAAAGLAGGLVLAVAYMPVSHAHFGTVDTLWALSLLLALDRMLAWIGAASSASAGRNALASGLWAGVSASIKYFSVLLGLHLVVAWFLARRSGHGRARELVLALVAVPLGFVLVAPGILVALGDALGTVDHVSGRIGSPGPLAMLDNLRWHAVHSQALGLGEPLFLLSLAGLVLAWRAGPRGRFLVLALVLLLPTLFLTNQRPVRYGMLVMTVLAATAGIALAALVARAPRALRFPLVLLCVAPSLARSLALDRLLLREDTRIEALAELRRRALPAADVVAIGSQYGLPRSAQRAERPYVVYGPAVAGRPGLALADLAARPPRLVLRELTAPDWAVPDAAGLDAFLAERYREVLRLESRRGAVELPDPVSGNPALMVAYESPWTMTRPGPPLVLYERIERD